MTISLSTLPIRRHHVPRFRESNTSSMHSRIQILKIQKCSGLYSIPFLVCPFALVLFLPPLMIYEVFGVPGHDTILHDKLLKPDGLCINTTHGVLICMPCGSIVNIFNIPVHFACPAHAKKPKPPKDLGPRLLAKFSFLTFNLPHPLTPVLPIFGLKSPLSDYLICVKCSHGYRNVDSLKRHKCDGSAEFYTSDVQTFGHETQDVYFPVESLQPRMLQSTTEVLFQSYAEEMARRPDFNSVVTVPNNYRELSQFVVKERWLELIENKDISRLQALVAPPTESEPWPILHRHVCACLVHTQDKIAMKALHSVRGLLGTRPS